MKDGKIDERRYQSSMRLTSRRQQGQRDDDVGCHIADGIFVIGSMKMAKRCCRSGSHERVELDEISLPSRLADRKCRHRDGPSKGTDRPRKAGEAVREMEEARLAGVGGRALKLLLSTPCELTAGVAFASILKMLSESLLSSDVL
jgi:hypothetical protein